jgi:hypothetical protein
MNSKKSNNKNEKGQFVYPHGKPVTRREFLASGTIPFAAYMTLPSIVSIFAKAGVAQAQDYCKAASVTRMAPLVNVNLKGGAGLTAQWIPLTEGRDLLPKYQKIGLGNAANLPITKAFSNQAPFWSGSGFLTGMQTSVTPGMGIEAMNKAHFVGMCQASNNDSSTNKFSIVGLLDKAGLKGKILPPMGQTDNGVGVGNAVAYMMGTSPLIVRSADNILSALGVAERLAPLSNNQKTSLFNTITSLSAGQGRKLASLSGGDLLSYLLGSANGDNSVLIGNPSSLDTDPLANTEFAKVWGITNNTPKGSADFVNAAMVYNAINGNAGSIGIDLGGYDYHGNDRNTVTTPADLRAGTVVGKILQSFHVMKSKGFVQVNSDGGVGAAPSEQPGASFTSDRGDAGAVYMMGYDPTGSVQSTDSQLGHMLSNPDAEAADQSFLVGGNPEVGAAAVFANYLSFNGMLGKFSTINEVKLAFGTRLDEVVKIHG